MPSHIGLLASNHAASVISGGSLSPAADATYYYRTFTGNGTLSVSTKAIRMSLFIVAGGGGGGVDAGGGGGAGGIYYANNILLGVGDYTITIGAGGTSGTYPVIQTAGGNSSIAGSTVNITVLGGGYGGYWNSSSGGYGGSGGGGGSWGGYRGSSAYNSTTGPYYGNIGAYAVPYNSSAPVYVFAEGGGGGATQSGQYGVEYPLSGYGKGGKGGDGLTLAWTGLTYAGGGGGGSSYYVPGLAQAAGGSGGGGAGQTYEAAAVAGAANRGSGGGGAWGGIASGATGAAGGSGIVIVRYSKADVGE